MLYIILTLLFISSSFSQTEIPINLIDYQQNPSHIEWKKIDTDHFEIIFPEDIGSEAQRAANLLEIAYPFVSRSMGELPPRISVVLQNQSVMSNGLVTLAPRRSEWFTTPSVDPELGNTEWIRTLAIHEFRHVVQFEKGKRGFNKAFRFILGEIGQALGLFLTLPPWYFEGDAVGIETALTDGGRGRLPSFERDLRTLLLSGKDFDYDKAHMRSYDDYVPNHYVYGYFLTTFLRNKYGDLFLSDLANSSAKNSWNPLYFYISADKLTGVKFEDFYRETISEMVKVWRNKLEVLTPTTYKIKNIGKRFGWSNYHYPQITKSGKIFALKNGLSYLNRFVLLDGEEERNLFYPGILINEWPYKLRNDRVALTELDLDPRWGYRNYNRLRVYDLRSEKFILDIRKTKWRLAILNHEGNKIAVVKWDVKQRQSIEILDLRGRVLKEISFPRYEVITSLDWLSQNELAIVIKDFSDLKSIEKVEINTGRREVLLSKTLTNLGFVTAQNNRVLVESPESGIDNIFVVENGKTKQLTSARFGAYAPVIHREKLIYNDYTVDGMNIVEKDLPWDSSEVSSGSFFHFYEKFAKFEDKDSFSSQLKDVKEYEVKDYSQFKNAFNPHSWMIMAPPLTSTITLAGYSRDILNKITLSAGGVYNLNEGTLHGFASAIWSHLYPVFDIRASYGNRRQDARINGKEVSNKWEEGIAEAGVQVPWRSIMGRFSQNFSMRAFAKMIKVTNKLSSDNSEISDGALYSPGAVLQYSLLSRRAQRDLLPPWGVDFVGHFEEGRDITGSGQTGRLESLDSRYYLPGLWHHHSFYHQFAYEKQRDDFYQYSSLISYPRGTRYVFLRDFTKYSANYTMPLFYPDWHWSRYVYFKRVFSNFFYDELKGRYGASNYNAASYGWEILSETHFLRLFFPLTIGLRGNYIIHGTEKEPNYEIFLATGVGEF